MRKLGDLIVQQLLKTAFLGDDVFEALALFELWDLGQFMAFGELQFGKQFKDDAIFFATQSRFRLLGQVVDVIVQCRDLERDRARIGFIEQQ